MLRNLAPSFAESETIEARVLSQLLLCRLPDAVAFKDARRRYLCLNEAECALLGVASPQDAVGKTADRLLTARRARLWRREETQVLVTGVPLIDRLETVELEDGTTKWLSSTKSPVRNAQGGIIGLVGITRDVTNQKHEELQKNQLVATISHELRTPVTSIMGALGVFPRVAGPLPEPAVRLLDVARMNGERLLHLINDILDFEKIESGLMKFDLKRVDVRALVEHEIAAIQSFAEPFGVSVRLDPNSCSAELSADPGRLAQVVSNLLSNAVKYSPAGQNVVVGIEDCQGNVRIWVRDHGSGIPAAFRRRIFDKFVQADRKEAHRKGGTGLGLAIVKQIVERMKGDVGFEPAPGGGTIFYVTLPSCEAGD
jgi:PAS domain S-box-containing protein